MGKILLIHVTLEVKCNHTHIHKKKINKNKSYRNRILTKKIKRVLWVIFW